MERSRRESGEIIAHAGHLAKAAGIELGPLASLHGYVSRSDEESAMSQFYGGGAYAARMMMARQAQEAGDGDARSEAVVASPTTATFQIAVTASFSPK